MSRYEINKALRQMILSYADHERFLASPEEFLDETTLTPAEREAFARTDYGSLYGMGAHPFLLWCWVTRTRKGDIRALIQEYRQTVGPHGYPDFGT